MYDVKLIKVILNNIQWAIDQVLHRSNDIKSYDQFINDDRGIEKLDSVCMQLINIGEALKQIDRITAGDLLVRYGEIDWNGAKGMRDIISHHYFDVDAEIVFDVVKNKLPAMKNIIKRIINEIPD